MALVLWLWFVSFCTALLGFEMTLTPPQTKRSKWVYRVSFIVLAGFGLWITVQQYKIQERRDAKTDQKLDLIITQTSPTNGSTVSKTIPLVVSATAADGDTSKAKNLERVEFYVDDATTPLAISTQLTDHVALDTRTLSDGHHTFYAKAYDAQGNFAGSEPIVVNVHNGTVSDAGTP